MARAMTVGEHIQGGSAPERLALLVLDADDGVGVRVDNEPGIGPREHIGHFEAPALEGDVRSLRTWRWMRCWKMASSCAARVPNVRICGKSASPYMAWACSKCRIGSAMRNSAADRWSNVWPVLIQV